MTRYRDLSSREFSAYDMLSIANAEKLRRNAARAAARNPLIAGVASGVTLTAPASGDAALTTRVFTGNNVGAVTPRPDLFSFRGGHRVESGSGFWSLFPVASAFPDNGNVSSQYSAAPSFSAWTWEVAFMCDAPLLEFRVVPANNMAYRVLVDGQYASANAIAPASYSGAQRLRLDFSSVRRSRLIQIRGRREGGPQSVDMDAASSVWAPPDDDLIRVAVTGDSFTEGAGTTQTNADPDAGFALQLGHHMGWADVRQVGVGSTGYLADASSARSRIIGQVPFWDLGGWTPDVIVCAAGYNDIGFSPAVVGAEAGRAWRRMRLAFPNARIFVFGPWIQARTAAVMLPIESALSEAFRAWGDPMSHFIPICADPNPWNSGTGRVGATTGSGNSDVYTSSDGLHPSDAGHAYLGRRMAEAIRGVLNTL